MKTLIVYGSKHGFTEECAMKLKEKMGKDVVCMNLKKEKVQSLESYGRVLIGSSIYAGMFQKEVKAFCEEHLQELLKKEVGIFGSGGMASKFREAVEQNVSADLVKHAKVITCFGGEFRFKQMNFFERAIVKMVSKNQGEGTGAEGFIPEAFNAFTSTWK
ncbi:MAG: flavodoxin domain-containing protein [Cellulosilyticaceae bacterium]